MKIFPKAVLAASILFMASTAVQAQEKNHVPAIKIQKMDGSEFNTGDLSNNGKPIIINFWATWCSPCKRELNNIAEMYDEWQEDTGVKLVAISIDDTRNIAKVAPYVNGKGWDYEVYIDPNGDFKRSLGVNNVPHTFLVDGSGRIVWQHNSYSEGDEYELIERVEALIAAKEVD